MDSLEHLSYVDVIVHSRSHVDFGIPMELEVLKAARHGKAIFV